MNDKKKKEFDAVEMARSIKRDRDKLYLENPQEYFRRLGKADDRATKRLTNYNEANLR